MSAGSMCRDRLASTARPVRTRLRNDWSAKGRHHITRFEMVFPSAVLRREPTGSAFLVSCLLLLILAQQGGAPPRSVDEVSASEDVDLGLRLSIRALKGTNENMVVVLCLRHLRDRHGELVQQAP